MKKSILLVLFLFFLALSPAVYASTTLPDGIYLEQQEEWSCTLASAAMMLRARTYLSNNVAWDSITENTIESSAWIDGQGLRQSFTYTFGGNYIKVARIEVDGVSTSSLKSVLNSHPEGIILYCRNIPHAVFVCDYEGDTFYCADPGAKYWQSVPSGRIQLSSSSLSKSYGSQAGILNNTTHYWYVSSYSIAPTEIHGSYMETGYDRVLPDGDYMIASAADPSCYLDISGGEVPAESGTPVDLWQTNNGEIDDHDAWTIEYSNGFYRITQYHQNVSLDVPAGSDLQEKRIQVWTSHDTPGEQWAISRNGDFGYRLEARCSGFSLDIRNGRIVEGAEVQQWQDNDSDMQRWVFIPYKPEHTLPEGRYIIVSGVDDSLELDVLGDSAEISDGTNVQLWHDNAEIFYENALSQYNSFDVTYVGGGYYQLVHALSRKVVDVASWVRTNGGNLQMWTNTGVAAQKWAITKQGDGYILRAKCSGLVMDATPADGYANGTNVQQWQYYGGRNQIWKFVPAEHIVTFNANGGSGAPSDQIKYYKGKLVLSSGIPTRIGYTFLGWATSASATTAQYRPGDEYQIDADLTLYAVWAKPDLILPASLTTIGTEAFAGGAFTYVKLSESCVKIGPNAFAGCPNLKCISIPNTKAEIDVNAFGNMRGLTIFGKSGSTAEAYALAHNFTFIPIS